MSNREPLMATGEGTGVQSRADDVSISVVEDGGPSSSHSNRVSKIKSAPQKRACHKSRVEWMMIFIDVVVCVLFLGGLIASLIHQGSKNHEIWGLELWKWFVLALVIVGGRRIMKLTEDSVVCLIRKVFFLLKCEVRYSYYIYSLGKYVRVFLWFGLVLLTCYFLFKSSKVKRSKLDSNVQKYIMRSLATCVIGGFLWVLKTLLVNILTPPFQATRLFDRFRESLIDQYILEVFSQYILEVPFQSAEKGAVFKWVNDNRLPTGEKVKIIKSLKEMEPEEISAWSLQELMTVISSPPLSSITNELEKLAKKEREMTKLFEETKGIADEILRSNKDNAKVEKCELHCLFKEECDVVQHITCAGEEGIEINRQTLRKWLVNAVVERRSLAQSLEDSKRAKEELNKIVSGTAVILVFIVWLIMMEILTTGALVVLITQFAALAFIFGDTGKSLFQGIVFVFVMHPFDVGDCCLISGEEMVVERINLLSTVFGKNMKDKVVYPNSFLTGTQIKNLDKGNRHVIRDSFEITIDKPKDYDDIADLINSAIGRFLVKHNDKWLAKLYFELKEIEDQKFKTVLTVYHRKTYLPSDWRMMNNRREHIVRKLQKLFEEHKIACCSILPKAVDAE
ncbi:hypothetical protein SLA2020_318940 [Shorea laevis]